MTRGSLLGQDPSGAQSLLAWTVWGAWSAWCRCLLRTVCWSRARHRGQPGHQARTCPLNRWGSAAAAHPHACFSKGCSSTASCAPLQRLWGCKAHTYRLARTYAHTHALIHIYTRMRTQIHIHTYKHKRVWLLASVHTHKHTHKHTHAHTYKRPNTQAHTRAHTHTRTHAYACTCCARDGLCQSFSVASDAPTLVISAEDCLRLRF
jgi:hypothetical protein